MTVTRACGHPTAANIRDTARGKAFQRELEQTDCRDCTRDQEHTRALDAARRGGYPELTGSPAQVRWAECLRADLIVQMGGQLADLTYQHDPRLPDLMAVVEGITFGMTDARWWIDTYRPRPSRPTALAIMDGLAPFVAAVRHSLEA